MRADPDFTAYVVARWRPVVRVLVVLGQSVERAEDVAVASFARLMSDWGRLQREVDVDVELARVVLDGWVRVRGHQQAQSSGAPPVFHLRRRQVRLIDASAAGEVRAMGARP